MSTAINQSFLDYCASYAGIDGGDDNAEYWFIGMEWSASDDITIPTDGKWNTKYEYDDDLRLDEKNYDDWKLEKELDKIYKKLLPKTGKTIFDKNSNSFKLNLFPIPFKNDNEKDLWGEKYAAITGFASFNDYQKGVIAARQKVFQELLQKGKHPKTIFCFGKVYESFFLKLFAPQMVNFKRKDYEPVKLPHAKSGGYSVGVEVYKLDTPLIKQILICPFPYTKSYKMNDDDFKKIAKIATE
ncbi:MAG: hypothetical protein VZR95_06010 [Alphaproteobacteria bacterium]